ncbi:MAG TPA: signal peptidase II [Candidatus Dormibacteraeota bacterium]|nr:signal peptidase II [Candidatus Dormibacteraeota bacterium]
MQGEARATLTLASPRRLAWIVFVAAVVFVLDRLTKNAVASNLRVGESREILDDYVRITHSQNTGAAFGLLPERTTLLSVLSVLAVLVILYYYRQLRSDAPLIATTLGLQLGGAFGNLVDRVGQGYVVDFIDVGIGPYRYWTFNVADSSIVVGIFGVLGLLWLEERKHR